MDIGPEHYTSTYAVVTVTLLMVFLSARKGVIELRDVVARCPACGRLRRRSKPCPCATRHDPLR